VREVGAGKVHTSLTLDRLMCKKCTESALGGLKISKIADGQGSSVPAVLRVSDDSHDGSPDPFNMT